MFHSFLFSNTPSLSVCCLMSKRKQHTLHDYKMSRTPREITQASQKLTRDFDLN